jgi:diguanylate cyclase (GGDEF)-like protein
MAAENGTGACCMLADLDDFKTINDTHGHDVGDMVLRGIARAIRRKLGANDLIGRLGGDEFAVLVTNVTRADAIALAKRVTESIEGKALRVREDLQLTAHFSLGAVYSEQDLDDLSIDNMLNLADQAMYQRKRSGKQGLVFKIHPQPIEPGGQNVMNPFPVARQIDRE